MKSKAPLVMMEQLVMVLVFPDPAPARMRSGPSTWVAASSCCLFKCDKSINRLPCFLCQNYIIARMTCHPARTRPRTVRKLAIRLVLV